MGIVGKAADGSLIKDEWREDLIKAKKESGMKELVLRFLKWR